MYRTYRTTAHPHYTYTSIGLCSKYFEDFRNFVEILILIKFLIKNILKLFLNYSNTIVSNKLSSF